MRREKRQPKQDWIVGGIYLNPSTDGSFAVFKVIAVDEGGVHVRLFANKFQDHPRDVDPASLTVGGIGWPEGTGIGHLPLSFEAIGKWTVEYLKQEPVTDDELDGYDMWKEDGAGYW